MKSLVSLVAVTAAIVGGASSVDPKISDCAGTCVGRAVEATKCASTNTHCICESSQFMAAIESCAVEKCNESGKQTAMLFASDFCETVTSVKPDLRKKDTRWRHRRHKKQAAKKDVTAAAPAIVAKDALPAEASTQESQEAPQLEARASPQDGPYWWDSNYPWPPKKGQHGNKPWWWPSYEAWPPTNSETIPNRPWWWPGGAQWPPAPGHFPDRPQWWPPGKQWPPPMVNTVQGSITATVTVTATVW